MRLINVQHFLEMERAINGKSAVDRQIKVLQLPSDKNIQYAILSHRWAERNTGETEEVNYEEMVELANMDTEKQGKIRNRNGYQKIFRSCKQAEDDGFEWLWVDTCCIDKRSSAEQSEAVNSMYRWYENSARCYVYLHDVPDRFPTERNSGRYSDFNGWPEWFSRGWTLQELIAPVDVRFFNKDWQFIGDKRIHSSTLQAITRVPQNILRDGFSTTHPCVAQIMSWAADRKTSRVEDEAYSLMGLLDVNMPLLYGEGKRAFRRLQLEIIRMSNDQSIFAWDPRGHIRRSGSVLADEPQFFRDCSDLQTMEIDEFTGALKAGMSKEEEDRLGSFPVTNRGIHIWLPLRRCIGSRTVFEASLQCRATRSPRPVTIYLTLWKSNYYRCFGPLSEAAFPKKGVPMFEQIHLRYQDVTHRNPRFEFDDRAVSANGFTCTNTYPDTLVQGNAVTLTSSNPLCVRAYANSQANCRFAVGFGQCFGQVWIHICYEEPNRTFMGCQRVDIKNEYNKMLVRGPEHAQSMMGAHSSASGCSRIYIKHTRLPRTIWTVRTCCMLQDSRNLHSVRVEIIQHPGFCAGPERWKGYDVEDTGDTSHCDMQGIMIIPYQQSKQYELSVDGISVCLSEAPNEIKLGDYGHFTAQQEFQCEGNIYADFKSCATQLDLTSVKFKVEDRAHDHAIALCRESSLDWEEVTLNRPLVSSLPSNHEFNSMLFSLSSKLTNRYLVTKIIQSSDDNELSSQKSHNVNSSFSISEAHRKFITKPLCTFRKPVVWHQDDPIWHREIEEIRTHFNVYKGLSQSVAVNGTRVLTPSEREKETQAAIKFFNGQFSVESLSGLLKKIPVIVDKWMTFRSFSEVTKQIEDDIQSSSNYLGIMLLQEICGYYDSSIFEFDNRDDKVGSQFQACEWESSVNEVKNLQERHDGTKDFGEKWALEEDIIGKILCICFCDIQANIHQALPAILGDPKIDSKMQKTQSDCLQLIAFTFETAMTDHLYNDIDTHLLRVMADAKAGISKHKLLLDEQKHRKE